MGAPSSSQKETASPITEKTEPTILYTKSFYFASIQHFNFWKIFHTNYLQGLYTLAPPEKRTCRVTQVETSLEHQLPTAQLPQHVWRKVSAFPGTRARDYKGKHPRDHLVSGLCTAPPRESQTCSSNLDLDLQGSVPTHTPMS